MLKSKKQKSDIVEFAKNLYLTFNEEGNHKYSLRDISTQIQTVFKKSIHHSTVAGWIKKYGWEALFQNAKNLGVTQAIIESESGTKGIDEKIVEIKSGKTKEIFQSLDYVFTKLFTEFQTRDLKDKDWMKGMSTTDIVKLLLATKEKMIDLIGNNEAENKTIKISINEYRD